MKWFLLLCFPASLLAQELVIIPNYYSNSYASPWSFEKGDTLILQADSTYLISKRRYNFYKHLHESARVGRDTLFEYIIGKYEQVLASYDLETRLLIDHSIAQENASEALINSLHRKILRAEMTLENTQDKLSLTEIELSQARRELGREKWASTGRKLGIGALAFLGGILVGFAIGM